jgi:ferredoxin-NADP reductase/predicted pyridoxine 5'-phosphate oxidase superfamily flavin-nucleotide-binding protein
MPNQPQSPSPWHRGERGIHERMGNADQMESFGRRVIRDYMPDQHRQFYGQLPFMVVGAVDAQGWPWATLIEGAPGFMDSPEPRQLTIRSSPGVGDPVRAAIQAGAPLGMLGIELHTRRRNRLNGNVIATDEGSFSVRVEHSFGNCPQYIQKRGFAFERTPGAPFAGAIERFGALDDAARATISAADTFFVASHFLGDVEHPDPSVDVSHRGGKPGFVQVDGNLLRIPDFAGNMHFNTFGNLMLNPKAGLVFVDFSSGDMLQVTGSAEVVFDGPEVAAFQGAERLWNFRVEHVVRRRNALALRWALEEVSPNSLMTGSWEDAQAKLRAAHLHDTWRPFRVTRVVDESSTVRSFYLEPDDGFAATTYRAGQHLPIRVLLDGDSKATIRTYTLSAAPSDGHYRLSIKREGRVSTHMHTQIRVGDVIEARAPQGDFVIDALERRPVVLLAGGIGVTPMLAMLRHIVFEGKRKRRVRPTYFVYAARNNSERGFNTELDELAQRGGDAIHILRVTGAPETGSTQGQDFDVQGRVDMALLKSILPFGDYDFFLCGPPPFMQALYDGLRALRVMDDRIHAEVFGPASLKRQQETIETAPALAPIAKSDVRVLFSESSKEARWTPAMGSLLELAEQRGLAPEFSCRGGSCGTCRTTIIEGQVTYMSPPAFHTEPAEALICCAMPAQTKQGQVERLVLKL